jgi:hypothetical protein
MKTYAKCTKFTPASAIVRAVLTAAFLAAFAAGSAAQAPAQSPSSDVLWVQVDTQGNRYVYYVPSPGATPVLAGKIGPTPAAPCPPGCVNIGGFCICYYGR